jgi:hypothetical protein
VAVPDPSQESRPPRPAIRAGHRLLGLSGAAFLVVLVITGLAAQHPTALGLDRHYIQARPLLAWYGIHAPDIAAMYVDQSINYAQLGERTYRGQRRLHEVEGELRGVATIAGVNMVATDRGVWLYDAQARFIDRFDPPGMPLRLGGDGGTALLETDQGTFRADADFLNWTRADAPPVQWISQRPTTEEQRRRFQERYLDEALSWERLLLDLHSGRLFGWLGPYLIDAVALVLLVTAITGLMLALRPPRTPDSDQ